MLTTSASSRIATRFEDKRETVAIGQRGESLGDRAGASLLLWAWLVGANRGADPNSSPPEKSGVAFASRRRSHPPPQDNSSRCSRHTFILDNTLFRVFLDAEIQWTSNPSDTAVRAT
jgi:hypothetical protein